MSTVFWAFLFTVKMSKTDLLTVIDAICRSSPVVE